MGHISNGVEWISDKTFRTPSGRNYTMVESNENVNISCLRCCKYDKDAPDRCAIDQDPEFDDLSCWGGSEDEGIKFYYFLELL